MHFSLAITKHILVCSNMSVEFTITILKSANLGTQLRNKDSLHQNWNWICGFHNSHAMQDVKLEYFL